MPSYELSLILRNIPRPELVQSIKRTSKAIVERGGILRSFENMGVRPLPARKNKHGMPNKTGVYFLINFDSPVDTLVDLNDHLGRDLDIIRPRFLRKDEIFVRPCERGPCYWGEMTDEIKKDLSLMKKMALGSKVKDLEDVSIRTKVANPEAGTEV